MLDLDNQIAEIVGWKPLPEHYYNDCRQPAKVVNVCRKKCSECKDRFKNIAYPPYSRDLNLITAAVEKLGYQWRLVSSTSGIYRAYVLNINGLSLAETEEVSDTPALALCNALIKAKGVL